MDSLHSGPLLGESDGLRVIDCHACGFAHMETLPDAAALESFYANDFWQRTKAGALERIEAQREWWAAVYGDWLELIERHAPGRTLLDVGCGYGHFIAEAVQSEWSGIGLEPNPMAKIHARNMIAKTFSILGMTWDVFDRSADVIYKNAYDCLSALWLIEHLPDPLHFLRWARSRLAEGGVLLTVVPNDFTEIQARANLRIARPSWWIDGTHLNYFTWSSFSNLLGRAGFRIVERQTQFPMEAFLLEGRDYTVDAALGADCHREVEQFDLGMTRAERLAHYGALAAQGAGREIVVVAVKE